MRRSTAALFVLLAACGTSEGSEGRADDILALVADPVGGADVFDAECSVCHGLNGEGGSGPSMAAAMESLDRAALVDILLSGVGSMPSFDDLPDQDLADVSAYVDETW